MVKLQQIAEISLALWYLSAEKVAEVGELVRTLRQNHGLPEPIDDTADWTEEDLREWTRASASRVTEEYPEEEGSDAVPTW